MRSSTAGLRGFHAKAWTAWLVAGAAVALSFTNPFASLATLAALVLIVSVFGRGGPEGRAFALLMKLGAVFLVVRVVLFALTGHTGTTTLFVFPSVGLPRLLGGFSLGGRVTGEVVSQVATEGISVMAFFAVFGVFLSVVETYRVLRLLPRFLFEAGLVASIAISFVPSLARAFVDVRDAQRLRGHRLRGVRALRPLIIPLLAGALERSLTLAASMECRGYGRSSVGASRTEARARTIAAGSLLVLLASGGATLGGATLVGTALAIAGAIGLAWSLRSISRSVERTRMRPERTDAWDRALIICSACITATALALGSTANARWYPYPSLHWPALDLGITATSLLLLIPIPLARMRGLALARASARSELPIAVEVHA